MPGRNAAFDSANTSNYQEGIRYSPDSYRDLCCNCNNGPECGYGSASVRPVFFCEQFDAFVPPPSVSSRPSTEPTRPKEHTGRSGLCANCQNAETCTFSQTAGGVWHCEEYL